MKEAQGTTSIKGVCHFSPLIQGLRVKKHHRTRGFGQSTPLITQRTLPY